MSDQNQGEVKRIEDMTGAECATWLKQTLASVNMNYSSAMQLDMMLNHIGTLDKN